MSTKRSWALTLAILLSACTGTLDPGESESEPFAPESVDSTSGSPGPGFVLTPAGYYHQSCIFDVGDASAMDQNGMITRSDGTTFQLPDCAYPHYPTASSGSADPSSGVNGWVTSAWKYHQAGYGKFRTSFYVPRRPATNGGLVYLFPGFEPADYSTILQPVLQFGGNGAFGGDYWTIASWACGHSCPHSSPRNVSVGERIDGVIARETCSGGACNWKITTTGAGSPNNPTVLTYHGFADFPHAIVALEAYGIHECSEYPNQNELVVFDDLYRADGSLSTWPWSIVNFNANPTCSRNTTAGDGFVQLMWTH